MWLKKCKYAKKGYTELLNKKQCKLYAWKCITVKKITLKQFKVPIKLFYDKYSELGMQWYPFQKV